MKCKTCSHNNPESKSPFENTAKMLGAVVLVGILGSGVAMAKGWGYDDDSPRGGHKGKSPMMFMLKGLDLSDTQKEKLAAIQQEMREEMQANRGQKQNSPMLSAIKDGKFDKTAYLSASEERFSEMSTKRAEHFEKVYNVLTDEQKKAFISNMESRKNCKGGRF